MTSILRTLFVFALLMCCLGFLVDQTWEWVRALVCAFMALTTLDLVVAWVLEARRRIIHVVEMHPGEPVDTGCPAPALPGQCVGVLPPSVVERAADVKNRLRRSGDRKG